MEVGNFERGMNLCLEGVVIIIIIKVIKMVMFWIRKEKLVGNKFWLMLLMFVLN